MINIRHAIVNCDVSSRNCVLYKEKKKKRKRVFEENLCGTLCKFSQSAIRHFYAKKKRENSWIRNIDKLLKKKSPNIHEKKKDYNINNNTIKA